MSRHTRYDEPDRGRVTTGPVSMTIQPSAVASTETAASTPIVIPKPETSTAVLGLPNDDYEGFDPNAYWKCVAEVAGFSESVRDPDAAISQQDDRDLQLMAFCLKQTRHIAQDQQIAKILNRSKPWVSTAIAAISEKINAKRFDADRRDMGNYEARAHKFIRELKIRIDEM